MSQPTPKLPKLKISRDEVRRLYVEKGLTLREIASKTGTSPQNVHHHLKFLGVELRKQGGVKRPPKFKRKLLIDLYVKQRMSMAAVGRMYGVSAHVIRRELDAHGIKTGRWHQRTPEKLALQKEIVELYSSGWSVGKIAAHFTQSRQIIYKELARAGVELRYKELQRTLGDLRGLYVTEKMPVRKICRTLGITRDRLQNELIRQKIPLREHKNPIRYPELASLKVGQFVVFPRTQRLNYHKRFFDDARRIGIRIKIRAIDEDSVRVTRVSARAS
jgi:predicted DNA-binding protein YlxM (UPF0122 family)